VLRWGKYAYVKSDAVIEFLTTQGAAVGGSQQADGRKVQP